VSEKFYRDKVASIKKAQGTAETALAKAHTAAAKYRSEAAKQRAKITPRTSNSMARSYQRAAEAAEGKAATEDDRQRRCLGSWEAWPVISLPLRRTSIGR
jgi:hypothetical protein